MTTTKPKQSINNQKVYPDELRVLINLMNLSIEQTIFSDINNVYEKDVIGLTLDALVLLSICTERDKTKQNKKRTQPANIVAIANKMRDDYDTSPTATNPATVEQISEMKLMILHVKKELVSMGYCTLEDIATITKETAYTDISQVNLLVVAYGFMTASEVKKQMKEQGEQIT
jgi:hypothetical protein